MTNIFHLIKRPFFGAGLGAFVARATAGTSAVHAAGMLLTFLVGVQLARGLGVHGYGQYGIAMAAIAIASIPGEFGLPRLVTRETSVAFARSDLPRLFGVIRWADRTALLLSFAAAGALVVGALLIPGDRISPVARAILVGAPIIPLIALMKIRGSTLRGMTFIVLGQVPSELLRPLLFSILLLGLFIAAPAASVADAMALNVLTAIVGLAAAFFLLQPRLPRPKPEALAQDGRRWLFGAFSMAMIDGLRIIQGQLVILAIGVILAAADVGLFRVAVATATMAAVPFTVVGKVAAPLLARLHAQEDSRRLQLLTARSAQVTTAGVLALSLPIILLGPGLIGLLFGPDYRAAYPALVVLCVGQIVHSCFGPNGNLLVMSGHEGRVTRASGLSLLLCMTLVLGFVPTIGLIGAALAIGFALLTWNVMCWRDARRLVGIDTSIFGGMGRQ